MAILGAPRISVARRHTTLIIGSSAATLQRVANFRGKPGFGRAKAIECSSRGRPLTGRCSSPRISRAGYPWTPLCRSPIGAYAARRNSWWRTWLCFLCHCCERIPLALNVACKENMSRSWRREGARYCRGRLGGFGNSGQRFSRPACVGFALPRRDGLKARPGSVSGIENRRGHKRKKGGGPLEYFCTSQRGGSA
jgi:hypothetical protein